MSTRSSYPFGLPKTAINAVLYSESRKPSDERDYRIWKSLMAPYVMKLHVKSANHLAKKDFFGLSDPYVKISILGDDMTVYPHFVSLDDDRFPQVYKTSVISKTLHPKWNQDFDFSISSAIGTVILDIYDKNTLIPDDFLGRVYVPFNLMDVSSQDSFPVDSSEPTDLQLSLGEKYRWDTLSRIPHLQDIYNHLSAKERRNQLKDHKVKGVIIVQLSFHHKERWEDIISRHSQSFDQQADMYRFQINRRRSSGVAQLMGGLFSSLVDTVRSYRSSNDDRSDEDTEENDSDNEDPLPNGWEERIDSNRRRMFVHHATRTTSLRRPRPVETAQTARGLRTFLPRSHSVEEEPPMPPRPTQTSRPSRASFVRQRSHSVGRGDHTGAVASGNTRRPAQRRVRRRHSLDESSRWEARVTAQGTSFAGFINLNDDSEPAVVQQQQDEQPLDSNVPSAPPLQTEHETLTETVTAQPQSQDEQPLDSDVPSAPPLQTEDEQPLDSNVPSAPPLQTEDEQPLDSDVPSAPPLQTEDEQPLDSDVPSAPPLQTEDEQPLDSNVPSAPPLQTEDEQPLDSDVPSAPPLQTVINEIEVTLLRSSTPSAPVIQLQSDDLPPGWQSTTTSDGRVFYIDHNTETTTWVHPNAAATAAASGTSQEAEATAASSEPIVEQDSDLPPGWEQRMTPDGRKFFIDHNTRTTTWEHPKKHSASNGPLPPGWEEGQLPDGKVFYMNHVTKETQWADPRIAYHLQQQNEKALPKIEYDRNYKQKYKNFKASLKPKHTIPNQIDLPVKRLSLLESSFTTIMGISDVEKLKSRLYVKFEGESGLDYGGLAREWFYLLSHEMFNPYYGLFEYSASDDYTLQINPYSHMCNENHLRYYKFIGRVCGMAVYHSKLVDAYFIRPFYKMMLKKKITLPDMQSVDVEFYNSLCYILENDPEPLYLQFSTTKEFLGEVTEVDLIPDGRNVTVTNSNKYEYVNLMLKWRFTDRVQPQMDALMEGFSELIPLQLLSVFDERELEYLLCGLPAIDVDDWKKNTNYIDYQSSDDTIMWFWIAVERFDNETRARLLQFVTGTSKVPMNGFSELQGSNGPKKFTIKKTGSTQSLPVSHTCFNRLDLPPYRKFTTLKEKLTLAVENTEGFAIE